MTYAAESSDMEVATVAVEGAAVTVTAVAAGSATITVTATNAGGSAEQRFAVTVQLPPVTLTLGGAAQAIELSEHFGDAVTGFDVSVSPAGVVQASMSGSLLTLTPLAVGTATVTLEVTAGEVSALHQFPATVAPAPPTALGSIAALTLAGRETHTVTASDYFAGEGVTYDAESSDTERRDGGGGWRSGDGDGDRGRRGHGHRDGDEREWEGRAELRRHGPTAGRRVDSGWCCARDRACRLLRR